MVGNWVGRAACFVGIPRFDGMLDGRGSHSVGPHKLVVGSAGSVVVAEEVHNVVVEEDNAADFVVVVDSGEGSVVVAVVVGRDEEHMGIVVVVVVGGVGWVARRVVDRIGEVERLGGTGVGLESLDRRVCRW